MAVGRLHAAVGLERSGRGVHERGTCPERVPERLTKKRLKNVTFKTLLSHPGVHHNTVPGGVRARGLQLYW